MRKVVIAGASGLVGRAAMEGFAVEPGWEVIGLSRRPPSPIPNATHVSLDLADADACRAVATASLAGATHLVYAALQEAPGLFPGWTDEALIQRNGAMLRNLVEPLLQASPGLQHVSLLHGTKAYGIHHPSLRLRGLRIPLREREPRRDHPNFYFVQEDYLLEKQRSSGFAITTFRPTVIYGGSPGTNMNPLLVIAAYASLLRDRGEPLHFPGSTIEPSLREAVDARLVANALLWAATAPSAANETFNLTNGDAFSWDTLWPAIAAAFGMEPGEHRPISLADELPPQNAAWSQLVDRYELRAPRDLVEFVGANSLIYTDMLLGPGSRSGLPLLNSTIKARQAGFHDCIDTEDMFREWFTRLERERLIPPRP